MPLGLSVWFVQRPGQRRETGVLFHLCGHPITPNASSIPSAPTADAFLCPQRMAHGRHSVCGIFLLGLDAQLEDFPVFL